MLFSNQVSSKRWSLPLKIFSRLAVRTEKTANVSLPKSKVKKQDCFCKNFYVILKSLCLTGNDSALCKKTQNYESKVCYHKTSKKSTYANIYVLRGGKGMV